MTSSARQDSSAKGGNDRNGDFICLTVLSWAERSGPDIRLSVGYCVSQSSSKCIARLRYENTKINTPGSFENYLPYVIKRYFSVKKFLLIDPISIFVWTSSTLSFES